MRNCPIDIEPEQVVRWLIAEQRTAPSKSKVVARRHAETLGLPIATRLRLGDEERADLSETATVVTLRIAPADPGDGWLLSVVVEDEIGSATSDDDEGSEEEQDVDVEGFYVEFLRPGRGDANLFAQSEGPAGKARLITDIESDRHASVSV
jgi:hypothetical protein